jgi:hypothetical protein
VVLVAALGSFGSTDRFADPGRAVSQLEPVTDLAQLMPLAPLVPVAPESTEPPLTPSPMQLSRPVPQRIDAAMLAGAPSPVAETPAVTEMGTPTELPAPRVPPAPAVGAVPAVGGDVTVGAAPQRPVRILVVGDSTAWSIGDGLAAWAATNPEVASVTLTVSPGCGFVLDGRVPADDGTDYVAQCDQTLSTWMNDALLQLRRPSRDGTHVHARRREPADLREPLVAARAEHERGADRGAHGPRTASSFAAYRRAAPTSSGTDRIAATAHTQPSDSPTRVGSSYTRSVTSAIAVGAIAMPTISSTNEYVLVTSPRMRLGVEACSAAPAIGSEKFTKQLAAAEHSSAAQ